LNARLFFKAKSQRTQCIRVDWWKCEGAAGKHVPHAAQACNLLLGTVQAACLTHHKVGRHLLLGSPLGAFY